MHMHALDWAIVAGLLLVLTWAALGTRRYSRSVAGFLAAERCGGRYLISVATGIASLGVITLVGFFEQNYDVGYTSIWWPLMEGPAWIIMGLSGWVIYRYRQTRALTLAQFFELRYSRRFRIFAGLVAYFSGIINFGIFPAISAHFFIALCGLPDRLLVAGHEVAVFPLLMGGLIAVALFFTFVGGQIAVMVTDFLQGTFTNIAFLILMVFLLGSAFRWDQIAHVLLAAPAGRSLVHPLHLGQEQQFNVGYYLIGVFTMFYAAMAWQGTQGYNSAARDPHEAKMASILGGWRFRVLMLIVLIMPLCARTLLEHPDFADRAATVQGRIAALQGRTDQETSTLRNQLRTPLAMAVIFPTGLLGLACAAALAAHIGTHGAYLHSWGAIFVQDVVLPFRRVPLSPGAHLWLLRLSITGVAVFIFLFSLLFPLAQYIWMFCALTAAMFVGGAGSVIIGGLYWKRGTTAGAWAAMLLGMATAAAGIIVKQVDPQTLAALRASAGFGWAGAAALFVQRELSGQVLSFCAMASSSAAYVLVSLLGPRAVCDMDRLLHRGAHAPPGETSEVAGPARRWWEKLGFTREFSGADRLITFITLGWPLAWTIVFLVVTGYNLAVDVPATSWLAFWRVWTWFILGAAALVTVWFTIGGARDLRALYRHLRQRQDNPLDDGRVAAPAPQQAARAKEPV
jgi:solute:Na+ symporter, SSS family